MGARAVRRKTYTVPFGLVFGALEIIASPLFLPFGIDAFRRRALAGGKKVAKGIGRAEAMVGVMPQPYRVIDENSARHYSPQSIVRTSPHGASMSLTRFASVGCCLLPSAFGIMWLRFERKVPRVRSPHPDLPTWPSP